MKLSSARVGQVVRNTRNGSHYRYEGKQDGKARIFPLELFPNGLLIPKQTPTTVEPDIEVVLIGLWADDLVVEGKSNKSRPIYERELIDKERELTELRVAYDALPKSGTGLTSRGSWANKVKAVEIRVRNLKRGLGFIDADRVATAQPVPSPEGLHVRQKVQVPSGRAAVVMGFQPMGDTTYATVVTVFNGAAVKAALPCEVLRPYEQSRLCTV